MQQCSEYLWGISGTVWLIVLIAFGIAVLAIIIALTVAAVKAANKELSHDDNEVIRRYRERNKKDDE